MSQEPRTEQALPASDAERLLYRAARALALIEEAERPAGSAILRGHLTCGDVSVLLSALVTYILREHPYLAAEPEVCVDLAATRIHEPH